MEISFSSAFKKAYKKRVKGTLSESAFWEAVDNFVSDPYHPRLKTHKLSGRLKGLWSITIEYDLRVVFYFTDDKPLRAVFVDIGTHDEVY